MTLPEQSNRAVAQTREFLVRLASPYGEGAIKGIRREIRAEALALLRHYPHVWLSQNGDCPVEDNVANADILTDTPAAHATPGEGSVQSECTLTNAEREAVERGIDSLVGVEDVSADAGPMDDAAACTLRGLIERLA